MTTTYRPTREAHFHCGPCDHGFSIPIMFGCYIDMVPGVSAEILEERCGMHDRYLSDIWCPKCGVTKFLTMLEMPKINEQPTIQKGDEPHGELPGVRKPRRSKR